MAGPALLTVSLARFPAWPSVTMTVVPLVRILRRVVHEGAYGATELVLIGTEAYALLDVRVYRAASLERDRIEFQHAFVNELAQVEILSGRTLLGGFRGGLIGTCEDEKLFDEALHGTRLVSVLSIQRID